MNTTTEMQLVDEERPIGVPTDFYLKTCLDGYGTFYFDKQILMNTYKKCREMCEDER